MSVAENGLPTVAELTRKDLALLPPRPRNGHKGTFGRVLVVGGSLCMSGAGYLAAKAALRAGCGMVELFCPWENRVIYQTQLPEALLTCYGEDDPTGPLEAALARADAVAIGMGLSQSETAKKLLNAVLKTCEKPLVIDADGLNLLAKDPDRDARLSRYPAPVILTPHMGEMSRLVGATVDEIAANPLSYAVDFAERSEAVVVLKSAKTFITDGKRAARNSFGNSGMATAGSGDVLAGITASFAARGLQPYEVAHGTTAYDMARCAVLTHALAGDAAKEIHGENGLIAGDIIDGMAKILP